MIRKLNENMNRSQLIDAIDNIYSYDDGKVDNAISKVLILTTSQLQQVYDIITDAASRSFNLSLNKSELYVLIDAMQNYSDPSFTKDREMSNTAKTILNRLRDL